MASELEDLGRRLRAGGYAEGATIVATLARSLRGLRLVPRRLPVDHGASDRLAPFRNRKVALDVRTLRARREALFLSRRGLALAARLSPSYVCNIESREPVTRVRWATVIALATVLEIAPEALLASEEPLR